MPTQFLAKERGGILAETAGAAPRDGAALFDELVYAVDSGDLASIVGYARHLARRRWSAGDGIVQVQVAINALEEAVWLRLFDGTPDPLAGETLRLVDGILAAAKDALAQEYVEQAQADQQHPRPSCVLHAL